MEKNEHERVEDEQIEDLDTPESEAEEVKGGLNFAIKGELSSFKYDRSIKGELGSVKLGGAQGLDGNTNQHNETLVVI
jgi:hypothetical protein